MCTRFEESPRKGSVTLVRVLCNVCKLHLKNGPFGPDQVLDSRYTELYFIFNFWLEAKSFKMQSSKKGSYQNVDTRITKILMIKIPCLVRCLSSKK